MNQGAREIRRRRYLQAMGVDSYITRRPLPAAASCRRLAIVRPGTPLSGLVAPETAVAPVGSEALAPPPPPTPARIERVAAEAREAPASEPAVPRRAGATPVESFSVAAVLAGKVLWLEELTQALLAQEQLQLLHAIARALGRPEQGVAVTQFDWPIHRNAQFDLGAEAARAGLSGFINRKLEQHACDAVVLLGADVSRRVRAVEHGDLPLLQTVSTAEMLAQPSLKRQAWRDLRTLVRK